MLDTLKEEKREQYATGDTAERWQEKSWEPAMPGL